MDPPLLAILILCLLFVLLAGGMPIGFAMGLSAFLGTLLLIDARRGARAARSDRVRDRAHLQPLGHPDVRADGLHRRRGRPQRGALSRLQRLARPSPRRTGAGDDRRLRRVRRDLRVEPRDRGDDGADRAAGNAPLQVLRQARDRRGRGRRHHRHPDPAQRHHGDLRPADRDQHLGAVPRRLRAGHPDRGRLHADDLDHDPDRSDARPAGRAHADARKLHRAAQRLGHGGAVPAGDRRPLYRHLLADRGRQRRRGRRVRARIHQPRHHRDSSWRRR